MGTINKYKQMIVYFRYNNYYFFFFFLIYEKKIKKKKPKQATKSNCYLKCILLSQFGVISDNSVEYEMLLIIQTNFITLLKPKGLAFFLFLDKKKTYAFLVLDEHWEFIKKAEQA